MPDVLRPLPGFITSPGGYSHAVLDDKMADIGPPRADLIVTSNTGCHMAAYHGHTLPRFESRSKACRRSPGCQL